jgi:cobalt-zinc-cadmium efflux system membrane fusion protein
MRFKLSTSRRIGAVAGLALVLAAAGCESDKQGTNPSTNNPADKAELFTIPAEQMSHVQVLTVQPSTLTRTLRLTGAVAYNSFRTTPVITQVSGPVSRMAVVPGQHVKAGQPMLYVSSPDYSQIRATYLKATDAYKLAQREYARAKDLYDHHAIAEKDLLAAESAEVQAGADLASSQAAMKVLGITDPDAVIQAPPSFEATVRSPIEGEVVEQDVSVGQFIQPGTTQCFLVSDVSDVWVLVNIYQKDLPYARVGNEVSVQTDAYPDVFQGKISYIATALDPNTRTLQARIETKNPGGKLKKDMYVVATMKAGSIKNAIAVPDAAVLRDAENQPFVYAEDASHQFGRRPVTLGESQDGRTEITDGLKAGDQIVGDGSLFLQFANSLQK